MSHENAWTQHESGLIPHKTGFLGAIYSIAPHL